jgi:hypothetical protein
VAGFLQLFATLFCLIASFVMSPVDKAIWPAKGGDGKEQGNEHGSEHGSEHGKEKRV